MFHYSQPVLITPLCGLVSPSNTLPGVQQPLCRQPLVKDLKAIHKHGKEFKLFVLRKINCGQSYDDLKSTIKKQFQDDIVANDFDVGIDSGGKVISLRTQTDMMEMWSDIQQGKVVRFGAMVEIECW